MQPAEGLSTAAIANPRLWRLGMELDTESATLDVCAVSTVGDDTMLCRHIALAKGVAALRALEDAVYDNPMLLADFDRTTILLRTPHFALLPRSLAEADAAAEAMELLRIVPDDDTATTLVRADVPGTDAAVVCAIGADIAAFLGRTFAEARTAHVLAPLAAYFAAAAPRRGNGAKIFAVASETGVDLLAFDGPRLLGATSYRCTVPDMAYYAAALAQVCGIASPELQFHVAGAPGPRDALSEALRAFAPHVMPWILPSGATGADADTPFPLLILPLCE